MDKGSQIYGWSCAAASLLYSTLGDGEKALELLRAHNNNRIFVMPNTMYIEYFPVIECSLFAAKSLQDMLIQSWGDCIRIFPAMPSEWKESLFYDLRAEGAFLVSAFRNNGTTSWVKIKSLAGEPCKVRPGFTGDFSSSLSSININETEPGVFEIGLKKGEEIILFQEPFDLSSEKPVEISN